MHCSAGADEVFKGLASQMHCQMVALCNFCARYSLPGSLCHAFSGYDTKFDCVNDQCIQSIHAGQL